MFIDFSLYLLLATLLLLAMLLAWRLWLRHHPGQETPMLIVYVRDLLPILVVVFVLRSFVLEPYRIPSGSMLPNLHSGDLILVTKYDYGIRLPLLNRVLIPVSSPQRGDALVFYHPENPDLHYIKRAIGLPGDHVRIRGSRVYVNGRPLSWSAADSGASAGHLQEVAVALEEARSQLSGLEPARYSDVALRVEAGQGKSWITMHEPTSHSWGREFAVPPGHYFVLGDNRDRSNDSRRWGFVPDNHIVGKARVIWMHLAWPFWSRNGGIDPIEAPTGDAAAAGAARPASPHPPALGE